MTIIYKLFYGKIINFLFQPLIMSIIADLLAIVGVWGITIISNLGYLGIFILMALESMIFPIPSEVVMPFAGFLIAQGQFSFAGILIVSSLGSLAGSLLSYYIGKFGGHKLILKYGKYCLLDEHDLKKTETWFATKGEKTILIGRFIPVVRHLISIPAGVGKMNLRRFLLYTLLGATCWNMLLAYVGYVSGKNWTVIRQYTEPVSIIVAILLVVGFCWFIFRHWWHKRKERKEEK